jgi:hypothetical protein
MSLRPALLGLFLVTLAPGCPRSEPGDDTDPPEDTDDTDEPEAPNACVAMARDFDLPGSGDTSLPKVRFDGEALWVGWRGEIGSQRVVYAARFACDGTLLAGPHRLEEGLVEPWFADVAISGTEAVVLMRDEGAPEGRPWGYARRVGVDGPVGEPTELAVGEFPEALAMRGDTIVAASSSETRLSLTELPASGGLGEEIARYELPAGPIHVSLAAGDELHVAWTVVGDFGYDVYTAAAGQTELRVVEGSGSGLVQIAAVADRAVLASFHDGAARLYDAAGTELLAISDVDSSLGGLALAPDDRALLVPANTLVPIDLALGTHTAVPMELLGWSPVHAGGDTWIVPGIRNGERHGRITFVTLP